MFKNIVAVTVGVVLGGAMLEGLNLGALYLIAKKAGDMNELFKGLNTAAKAAADKAAADKAAEDKAAAARKAAVA